MTNMTNIITAKTFISLPPLVEQISERFSRSVKILDVDGMFAQIFEIRLSRLKAFDVVQCGVRIRRIDDFSNAS